MKESLHSNYLLDTNKNGEADCTLPQIKTEKVIDVCACELHAFTDDSTECSLCRKDDIKSKNSGSTSQEHLFGDGTIVPELIDVDRYVSENYSDNHFGLTVGPFPDMNRFLYRCSQCVYSTTNQDHFISHQTVCDATFKGIFSCDDVSKYSTVRPYKCTECDARFKLNINLTRHILQGKHYDARRYHCNECDSRFKLENYLTRHLQAKHSVTYDARPHPCDKCDARFNTKYILKRHMLSKHSDSRPYHCTQCNATFKQKTHLNSHIQTQHSDVHKYHCNQCDKKYKTKPLLNSHILRKHSISPLYPCPFCGSGFEKKSDRNFHIRTLH